MEYLGFEWDKYKNRDNFKKHGIRFEEVVELFSRYFFSVVDDRKNYGEVRSIAIGEIDFNIVIVAVYTLREDRIRLISARRANYKERKSYYAHLKTKT